jgi:tRNA 2-selenouridine synthase
MVAVFSGNLRALNRINSVVQKAIRIRLLSPRTLVRADRIRIFSTLSESISPPDLSDDNGENGGVDNGQKKKVKRPRSKPQSSPDPYSLNKPVKYSNVISADIKQLTELDFDTIIDVRSPDEYEIDHIPGAVNYPVLDNEERIVIGTLHNGNVFEARRRGAALISRHITDLLENEFKDKPKSWRPLVYCWRGGLRSGSLAIVIAQVGWQVHQLSGGYKAYRHEVTESLPIICSKIKLKVISAPTGSGKTHFLDALRRGGKQVIDLEGLATHRGSVLGNIPGEKQPSQRMFDSKLLVALQQLDLSRTVYIESESRKIGKIALPDAIYKRMHESEVLFMDVPQSERVSKLCEDYLFYIKDPELLISHLDYLSQHKSKEKLDEWSDLARTDRFPELVTQLLELHYDPLYWKSLRKNYPQIDNREVTQQLIVSSLTPEALDEAVTRILERPYTYPEHSTVIENKITSIDNEGIESFVGENFPI